MPNRLKEEIILRTKEWYGHFREIMGNRDRQTLEQDKIARYYRNKKGREKEVEEGKPDREESELEMLFTNWDRFDRFLVGFLVIVSTVIDRNYFTMTDEKCLKTMDETKIVILETPETPSATRSTRTCSTSTGSKSTSNTRSCPTSSVPATRPTGTTSRAGGTATSRTTCG